MENRYRDIEASMVARFSLVQNTQMGKIYPNGENIPKWVKYTKMGKIYQNGENIPKWGKYTK
jgi:hypothetical protein